MPTYKVKPEDNGPGCAVSSTSKSKKSYPTVYFPISPEIMKELEVGSPATVTLTGTIVALENRQNDQGNKAEARLEVRQVEAYAGGEMDDDEDESTEKENPTMKDEIDKGLGYGENKA